MSKPQEEFRGTGFPQCARNFGIYQIKNTVFPSQNKIYSGISLNLDNRYSQHSNNLEKFQHDNPILQKDYGELLEQGKNPFDYLQISIIESTVYYTKWSKLEGEKKN